MARDATMPGRVHVGLSAEAADGPLGLTRTAVFLPRRARLFHAMHACT